MVEVTARAKCTREVIERMVKNDHFVKIGFPSRKAILQNLLRNKRPLRTRTGAEVYPYGDNHFMIEGMPSAVWAHVAPDRLHPDIKKYARLKGAGFHQINGVYVA